MDNLEIIVGRTGTLRLSMGTARLLYRGVLSLAAIAGPDGLPQQVRNYLERRRAMLGCQPGPINLNALLSGELDGFGQRSLANSVRHIAMAAARSDSAEIGINPAVRIRFVAALIEVYRLLCASLPLDLTLPPPVGISLSRNDWRLIELERLRLRCESEGAAVTSESSNGMTTPFDRSLRDEMVHRQISVFAG